MTSTQCPVCRDPLVAGIRPWHLTCKSCKYEGSNLELHIVEVPDNLRLDEESRECALMSLRQRNFERIRRDISRLVHGRKAGLKPRLLDVGCAHGWFLQACQSDFEVMGIEPDAVVANAAAKRVGPIRRGFFPNVLSSREKFDVIAFNDVLEHIPDIESVLYACNRHLSENGWLLINAPNRSGAIYRTAKFLAHIGLPNSFDRMWQFGFPSPHVHYLDTNVVRKLGAAANFELVRHSRLPSITVRGLYSRIRYSKKISRIKAVAIVAAILIALPVFLVSPPDIKIWYLRKHDEV